jgi:RNA polymerase sigma-70 factor (ECF subfamily)
VLTSGPPLVTNFSSATVYLDQSAEDQTAVKRCLAGDSAAFEGIVTRYQQVLFTVALRMLGDEEAARDAAQDTFIKVFEKLDTYDPQRRFFSWLYRILMNECLNVRRRPSPVRLRAPLDDLIAQAGEPDLVEEAERRNAVKKAILSLPEAYREVIVLRHFAALSYDEMSEAIGVPAKTVKSRLYSARQQLAEQLGAWMGA